MRSLPPKKPERKDLLQCGVDQPTYPMTPAVYGMLGTPRLAQNRQVQCFRCDLTRNFGSGYTIGRLPGRHFQWLSEQL